MPKRKPRPRPEKTTVTVYDKQGNPHEYPSAQAHRIKDSKTFSTKEPKKETTES